MRHETRLNDFSPTNYYLYYEIYNFDAGEKLNTNLGLWVKTRCYPQQKVDGQIRVLHFTTKITMGKTNDK
jgi:hypothetical protein